MKLLIIVLLLTVCVYYCLASPVSTGTKDIPEAKSAFGEPFDEIVVESSLTVKRKSGARQTRNKDVPASASASISSVKRKRRSTPFPSLEN